MVQNGVILCMGISIAICFLTPAAGFIILAVRRRRPLIPFAAGALAFTISQMLIRIPVLQSVLPNMIWFIRLQFQPVLYALFLGLSAGIFEETARYAAFKFILKKRREYADGLAFGFGHGGIEAILLVGISAVTSLLLVISVKNGTFDKYISILGAQNADIILKQIQELTPLTALLSGIERLLVIAVHTGLSMMILAGINKKREFSSLIFAVLIHAALNMGAVLIPLYISKNALITEVYIALFAVFMSVYTLRLKRKRCFTELNPYGDGRTE